MEELRIPNHVGIILDGNRRWAKEHFLPQLEGHRRGFENIRKLTKYIFDKNVKYLSVFAFSTENFKRTKEEVKYLMDMFVKEFTKEYDELHNNDVIIAINEITAITKNNTKAVSNICLNYGGRKEIVDTTKLIAQEYKDGKISLEDITEDYFSTKLYHDLPPIDLLIRTSGEYRVSNFMLWQLSYAEFYFPKCHWPAFNEHEFDKALIEYNKRDRRLGGNSNEKKNNQ